MNYTIKGFNDNKIIKIISDKILIKDVNSSLDLLSDISYHYKTNKIIINKENIEESLFDLSTKVFGEILQKYVNYNFTMAIVGDFSNYSKSLKDFIKESNKGKNVFFYSTDEETLEKYENLS